MSTGVKLRYLGIRFLAESAKADEEILKELAQKELEASGTLSRDTQNKLEDAKR